LAEERLKVLIADDHPLIIAGLRRALEGNDDMDIVGEAHSGTELVPLVERRRPDVVLLDLRMPGLSGDECVRRIVESWPETKTIVLSACDDQSSIDAAMSAGASAYVIKSVKAIDVASLVRQVAAGAVFQPRPAPRAAGFDESGMTDAPVLTEREQMILDAVASGLTTAAISEQLWVSQHTVKFHLTNIYRKLGVENRASAIRYALEHRAAA
jgi:DNA-binding NarL/FixJ family response regulator